MLYIKNKDGVIQKLAHKLAKSLLMWTYTYTYYFSHKELRGSEQIREDNSA